MPDKTPRSGEASKSGSFQDKLDPEKKGPKKLLALDGGGIRGLMSLEFLRRIEALVREKSGDDRLVLADYFDYIAGTSTGGIIATCLALGMTVDEVGAFYREHGRAMFEKSSWLRRFRYSYEADNLKKLLQDVIAKQTGEPEAKFGTEKLRTLLMIVLRNATTDSPWPLSNNPAAMFNDQARPDSNLKIPLWQIVRASTAAPTYFPPEVIKVGGHEFIFVDGGVTMYNNPALQLFMMATVDAYNLGWPAGRDAMLLVSVGTGAAAAANKNLKPDELNLLYNASSIPSALMSAASAQQDFLCRVLGYCRHGAEIDMELGPLTPVEAKAAAAEKPADGARSRIGQIDVATEGGSPAGLNRLFTYVRYNVDLSQTNVDELAKGIVGLGDRKIKAEDVQALDGVDHMGDMSAIAAVAARRDVKPEHFDGFLG